MFDGGGAGGFDMSNLLAQAQAMQNQLMEAQADLESQEIEPDSSMYEVRSSWPTASSGSVNAARAPTCALARA